jgi:hypothetical protein
MLRRDAIHTDSSLSRSWRSTERETLAQNGDGDGDGVGVGDKKLAREHTGEDKGEGVDRVGEGTSVVSHPWSIS